MYLQAEVPKIPDEEMAYVQQMLAQLQKQAAAKQAATAPAAAAQEEEGAPQQLQIDEWILQFVDLLKEHCGIDPDKPLECQEVRKGELVVCGSHKGVWGCGQAGQQQACCWRSGACLN